MTLTYYLKNNLIFSNNKKEFTIILGDSDIEIDSSVSFPKSNELLLKEINIFEKNNSKKIEILGLIEDFEEMKKKIELKKYEKLEEIKENDYKFIECTSQIIVLNNYIEKLKTQHFKLLDSSVNKYLKEIIDIEKRKVNALKNNIASNKKKIKKLNLDKKNYEKNEFENIKKKIESLNKELELLEKKEKKLEEKINYEEINPNSKKIEKILKKIDKHEYKYNDLEFKIKIYEIKKKNLTAEQKKGTKKHISPFLFVLTLGLIYWTPYSEIKNAIIRNQQKTYTIEMEMLELKRKIKNYKQQISEIKLKKEDSNKDNVKKKENLISEYSQISIDINSKKKEILKQKKEEDKKEEKLLHIQEKISSLEIELDSLTSLEKHYQTISSTTIKDKILSLRYLNKNNLEELETIKNTLESQKININGEWCLTF